MRREGSARPRLGLGVPVRNGEPYLAHALDALLAQTHHDFVLLIGDNASTDRTEEVARDYAARDSRIRYHRHPEDIGLCGNYSFLFHEAGTELFRWNACDDLVLPEYSARCIEALDAHPDEVLAYCRTIDIDSAGRELGPYEDRLHSTSDSPRARFHQVLSDARQSNPIYGVFRSEVARRTALLRPYHEAGTNFLAEMALRGKFHEVPEYLFRRRYHDLTVTNMAGESRRTIYKPSEGERPSLGAWNMVPGFERALIRTPMPLRERSLLQADILTMAGSRWLAPRLKRELIDLGRDYVNRVRSFARRRRPRDVPGG